MSILTDTKGAIEDLSDGMRLAPLWWRLGIDQTVARYRRTVLGPFWLSSSSIATGFALSIVFGAILGGDWRQNFPFILSGVIVFGYLSSLVIDGSNTFMMGSGMMQVRKLPLSFHAALLTDRSVINFAHQLAGFWIITLILRLFPLPHWQFLLTFPLVTGIGFFSSFPLGMISARYRDVNYFIGFIMQTLFMLTPVFWKRSQIPPKLHWIVDWNPFAHMIEIVRQPLLGHPAPIEDLVDSIETLGIAMVVAVICLAFWRRRVVFWL